MNATIRFLILLALALGSGCSLPLRRSEEAIEAAMLRLTPLGSTPDVVLAAIAKKGWKTKGYRDGGFYQGSWPSGRVVGVSSIEASLGDYVFFYTVVPMGMTDVTVFWGFDADNRLIEIWIKKTADSS